MTLQIGTLMAKAGLDIDTASFSQYSSMLGKMGTTASSTSSVISGSFSSGLSGASSAVQGFSTSSSGAFQNIESGASSAGSAFTGLGTSATTASNTISGTLSTGISKVGTSLTGLASKSSTFQTLSSGAKNAGSALSDLTQRSVALQKEIGATGTIITGLVSGILVSGFAHATEVFSNFDDAMRQVQAVTSASTDQFSALTAEARQLGAETSFTAQEAASGMRILGQAGFDANEILSAMPSTLNLSRASMTGLDTTVSIMTSTMRSFQIGAENTSRVSDVLSKAANSSATDVTGLGEAMKYAAPLADQMGWSLEATTAIVGQLSNAGIKGSMAGTVIRNSITRLIAPTSKVTGILKSYGISLDAVNPKMHSMADILDLLMTKGVDAGDIMTIFGQRAGPGILALVGQGTGALRDLETELDNSSGYAAKAAKEMDAGLGGALRILKSAIESVEITIGEDLSYFLTDAVKLGTKLVNTYQLIPDPIRKVGTAFAFLGTMGLVAISGLGTLGLIASAAAPALTTLGISADLAAGSITILGTTMTAVEWATGIGEIMALAAALIYFDEKTGLVSDTLSFFYDAITVDFYSIKNIVGGVIDSISGYLDDLKEDFNGISSDLHLDAITGFFSQISSVIGDSVGNVHTMAESYRNENSNIQTSTSETEKSVTNLGTTTQNVATDTGISTGIISQAWDTLSGDVSQANQDMASAAETSADDASTAWEDAINEMEENYNRIALLQGAGVENVGKNNSLANDLAQGIQGYGEVLGQNDQGELVIQSVDGTIQKLNQLDATQSHVFQGIDKNYGIIIDDGSRNDEQIGKIRKNYEKMGDEVIVVKKETGTLANTDFSQAVSQFQNFQQTGENASNTFSILNGQIQLTNSGSVANINGQVENFDGNVQAANTSIQNTTTGINGLNNSSLNTIQGNVSTTGSGVDTLTGKVGTGTQAVSGLNNSSFGTIQNNISTTGSMVDTNTGKTNTGISTFNTMNNSPFGTLFGNLNTTGSQIDTNTGKTDTLNSTLGSTNNSPFGTLFGNLGTSGSMIDTDTGKTGDLNSTLGNTNSSQFGTLHGNLSTTGSKIDLDKSKTDDLNSSMSTLGGFSFSTTISSLGSVYNTLGNIYDRAKDTISTLLKVGSSSSNSSNKSASGSTTNNNSNNTTIYVSGTTHSASSIVSTILSKRSVGK